jgi:hypothetical protein
VGLRAHYHPLGARSAAVWNGEAIVLSGRDASDALTTDPTPVV